MTWLEIIHLRSSGEPLEALGRRIAESIREEGEDADVVTLYRRRGLDTDLAVHVRHAGTPGRRGASDLALRLTAALREYGLVQHTLWEELN